MPGLICVALRHTGQQSAPGWWPWWPYPIVAKRVYVLEGHDTADMSVDEVARDSSKDRTRGKLRCRYVLYMSSADIRHTRISPVLVADIGVLEHNSGSTYR